MPQTDNVIPEEAVRQRATHYIKARWGSLRDLPKPLIAVIWVTVYRSLGIAMRTGADGGPKALLKNTLIGDGQLMPKFQEATLKLDFLTKMISVIRSNPSRFERLADAQLAIDVLKWGIVDAGSMSGLRRTILRQFAKADPEYKKPIPREISF